MAKRQNKGKTQQMIDRIQGFLQAPFNLARYLAYAINGMQTRFCNQQNK